MPGFGGRNLGEVAVDPVGAGFAPERLARIESVLAAHVAAGRIPGAVVGLARKGRLAHVCAVGVRDPRSDHAAAPEALLPNAVFSIASMTKPMVSAVAMQLLEEGQIALCDPVSEFLPALADLSVQVSDQTGGFQVLPSPRVPTIYDLLRHTAGFTYQDRGTTPAHQQTPGSSMAASVRLSRDAFLAALADAPLLYAPGTRWEYGFSTDVLGHVIEAVTGQDLGVVLQERIWGPLGMIDTGFQLRETAKARYAHAFSHDPQTGAPISVLHATGQLPQWESGGGGAVSTAGDYLAFLEAMRLGGGVDGVRILAPRSVAAMMSNHLTPDIHNALPEMEPAATGYGFGLGFAVRNADGGSALMGSAGDVYWSGVYGTYFWIDPRAELSCVFLCVLPTLARQRYRQLIRALVYQAMAD